MVYSLLGLACYPQCCSLELIQMVGNKLPLLCLSPPGELYN